jgi:Mg2+/Co2+ transporter CorB
MKTFTLEPSVLEAETAGRGCRVVRQMLLTQSPVIVIKSADGIIKSIVECEDAARLSSKDDIESIFKLPYIVFEDEYAVDVKAEMESNSRKYAVVVDGFKHFKGIISKDDLSIFKV